MTPQNVITEARFVLNDTNALRYRNTDTELLAWINDALDVALGLAPELFTKTGTHVCTAGAEQAVILARCVTFNEVIRVVGGGAVLPASRETLDAFLPSWYSTPAATAVNWMPFTGDPTKFYLYPPAAVAQAVQIRYVEAPPVLTLTDTIPLSDNYQPALVQYVVALASFKDDESVNSNRSAQAKADFAAMIKGA